MEEAYLSSLALDACIGSLVCITFVIYILACTQIHASRHELAENIEMLENLH